MHVKQGKEYNVCAEAAWSGCLLWQQLTGCKDGHLIEENHESPIGKTKMECGEFICLKKKGGKFCRR